MAALEIALGMSSYYGKIDVNIDSSSIDKPMLHKDRNISKCTTAIEDILDASFRTNVSCKLHCTTEHANTITRNNIKMNQRRIDNIPD